MALFVELGIFPTYIDSKLLEFSTKTSLKSFKLEEPLTVVQLKVPLPSVVSTWSTSPSLSGSVNVISVVTAAGAIILILLFPLSESSYKSINPELVAPFLDSIPPENVVLVPAEPTDVNPVIVVILFCVAVLTVPSKLAINVPVEIVRSPVDTPVIAPVPITNLSVLSSKPINALFSSPLSITIPESPLGVPVLPFPSSINKSVIVVFSSCVPVVKLPGIETAPEASTLNICVPSLFTTSKSVFISVVPNFTCTLPVVSVFSNTKLPVVFFIPSVKTSPAYNVFTLFSCEPILYFKSFVGTKLF